MKKWNDRLNNNIDAYRPITFWSWNAKLEDKLLRQQIREMKNAGMGGFFMHARAGLQTPYMEDEWFQAVEVSMDEAEKCGMQAWCYDENGFPSGFAGMKLLENEDNLVHYITFREIDSFDDTALAVYMLDDNKLIRLHGSDESVQTYYAVYDNVNTSVVDVLNERVVREFIELTHEKYYERYGRDFGNRLMGFFTDEPQYFRYDTPYSPVLLELYSECYAEDLLDGLASLFLDCENCYRFRYRYWKMLNDQFTKSFIKQVYEWCEEHNCKLTGHAIEESVLFAQMWCCAGVMPFYEYEHIPGIDWLGRNIDTELSPKQVGSVAQQLGRKQVLTESFACTGWDVSLRELKRILEWQYVNGVNLLCTHLTPYSLEGSRKYDHPTFFGTASPWFEQFSVFSDYVAKLGCMLSESSECAPVGVIHPIHSAYLTYRRKEDKRSIEGLENDFASLIERLGAANIPHHYIDETLLSRYGKVCGEQLQMGLCQYEYIIIPKMLQLDATTVKLLKEYIGNGGKIWLAGEAPSYVNGEEADLSFLKSNICFSDLQSTLYEVNTTSQFIRSTYRKSEQGDFVYLVNLSEKDIADTEIKLLADGVSRLYLEDLTCENLEYSRDGAYVRLNLTLQAGEPAILLLCNAPSAVSKRAQDINIVFTEPRRLSCDKNSLPLDEVQLSYDGVNYMEPMPIPWATEYLLSKCENREVYLKYRFHISDLPKSLMLETEKMNMQSITLNGQEVRLEDDGILDVRFMSGDVLPYVQEGDNELVIQIDYYQRDWVYDVLYRTEGVTETLINCLTYDTEISSVYLRGEFGVYSSKPLKQVEETVYVLDSNISIGEIQPATMGDMTINGYPFFAGKVTFAMEAEVDIPGELKLRLQGRYASAKLRWNDYETDVVLSEFIRIPEQFVKEHNQIVVTLFSGNRNLLGPHHWAKEPEPKAINPTYFTMGGRWENGKSEWYRDSYSLISFGAKLIY